MRKPGMSVVIPVHNKEPHIERCLASVLGQTYEDFEVVLIDDASTDGSARAMQRLRDSRIRIFERRVPGPGGYEARNLGIAEARGEWIAFLDADDEWNLDHLARTSDLMVRFPSADVLSCGWITHASLSSRSTDGYYSVNATRGDHSYDIHDFIRGARPIWTSVATVRRRRLMDVGGFDESWKHGGDTALWLKLFLTGSVGAWYSGLGAIYFKDSVNMVTKDLDQTESPAARVVQHYLSSHPSSSLRIQLRSYADRAMLKPTLRLMTRQGISRADLRDRFYFATTRSRLTIPLSFLPRAVQKITARHLLRRYEDEGSIAEIPM